MELDPRYAAYAEMLRQFNATHNLISRTDEAGIMERHIRHCLALTRRGFPADSTVVDWGTGGGLPAIPLAIAFPLVRVVAIDAVAKKTMAVRTMARRLGLTNLEAWHGRAEAWTGSAHYAVSRATAPLTALWNWYARVATPFAGADPETHWPPGLVCLKGGDLAQEIDDLARAFPDTAVVVTPLEHLEPAPYFAEKVIVQVTDSRR